MKKDKEIKQIMKDMESLLPHKCHSLDCQNQTTRIWCKKCLTELGEYIEQHPISSHKRGIK